MLCIYLDNNTLFQFFTFFYLFMVFWKINTQNEDFPFTSQTNKTKRKIGERNNIINIYIKHIVCIICL